MKKIFIEPRNVGKTLKIKQLYENEKNKGCFIIIPNNKIKDIFNEIDKNNISSNIDDIKGKKINTLLIDEYFLLNQNQLYNINQIKNLYENIIAFGTPINFYPQKLLLMIRNFEKESSESIFEKYVSEYYPLFKPHKNNIIKKINDMRKLLISDPNFIIINTIINDDLVVNYNDKNIDQYYDNIHYINYYDDENNLGHYLEEDLLYWNNYLKLKI